MSANHPSRTPFEQGYASDVVRRNVEILVSEGKTADEAHAIAMRHARRALRAKLEEDGIPVFAECNVPGKMPAGKRELEEVVRNYNEAQAGRGYRYEAPFKLTHATGGAALGWVRQLKLRGKTIVALARNPQDELLDAIITEKYPNPSVELRPRLQVDGKEYGLTLRAVAMMGADPPAVKELETFGEDERGEYVSYFYNEWNHSGDPTMPDNPSNTATAEPQVVRVEVVPQAAPVGDPSPAPLSDEERERIREEGRQQARAEAQAESQRQREEERRRANADFVEGRIKEGAIAPKDRLHYTELLNAIDPAYQYSDNGGNVALYDETRRRLSELPSNQMFGESELDGETPAGVLRRLDYDDDAGVNRDKIIREHMKRKGYNSRQYQRAMDETGNGTYLPA